MRSYICLARRAHLNLICKTELMVRSATHAFDRLGQANHRRQNKTKKTYETKNKWTKSMAGLVDLTPAYWMIVELKPISPTLTLPCNGLFLICNLARSCSIYFIFCTYGHSGCTAIDNYDELAGVLQKTWFILVGWLCLILRKHHCHNDNDVGVLEKFSRKVLLSSPSS